MTVVELAQVWVPLMPETSKMAQGVKQIAADADKQFGRTGKVLGGHLAKGAAVGGRSMLDVLKQVEARTVAVERATRANADAIGRVTVAEKRLQAVKENAKSTDLQRVSAQEAYNRAQRTESATKSNLTRTTRALTAAEKDLTAAKSASANVKVPLGARVLAAQAERAGAESGQTFVGGFKRVLATGAGLAAGGGMLAAARSVMTAGLSMDSALNSLQGVTRATGTEMAAAQQKAQALGVDTQLAGVSATDAARAMAELAKGGFTVQQSMDAARGTLQLATAAQIDAADAATIQADALHTFQLPAADAVKVADMLAGAANASTGDIHDFALGLAQAGPVASGFGVSIQDTLTSLAMFANFGIKGSDAGTLLKTSLQAITDQGKPAQAAIDKLGLSLYDAQDKFIGYPQMMRQVADASQRMSEKEFQAATNVLFGSDAMRGSMVAAKGGVEAFDGLAAAVTRAGNAQDMSAAKMQGLPGTVEKMKNSAEGAKIAFYEMVKPLAEASGEKAAGTLNSLAEAFGRMKQGGILAGFDPATTGIIALLGGIYLKSKLAGPALSAAAKATDLWSNAFSGWKTAAKDAADGMDYVRMSTGDTVVQQRGWATQMRDSYRSAAEGADRFHRSAGFAGAAMTGMKSAGSGLLSLLGGPWGVAAMGVTTAIGLIATKHAEAAQAAAQQRAEEEALQATLDKQTGAATEESRQAIAQRFTDEGTSARAKSYGIDPSLLTAAAIGDGQAYARIMAEARDKGLAALNNQKWTLAGGGQADFAAIQAQYAKFGVTSDQLQAALLRQGTAWDDVSAKIKAADPTGSIVPGLQQLIDTLPDANESIVTMAQNVNEASQQMKGGADNARLLNETMNGTWKATDEGIARFRSLGAEIASVPDSKTIVVKGLTEEAEEKLKALGYTVTRLPDGTVKVVADTDEAQSRITGLVQKIDSTTATVRVNVMTIDSGSGHADAAARAAVGEVTGHGGRAGGGYVDSRGMIHGPGTGTSDSIFARVMGGRGGVVRVSNRESINTARSTQENWPLIDAMNRGFPAAQMLRRMTGFSEGGIVGMQNAVSALLGAPYVRGGHSPSGTDCSGAASWIVNGALGLPQSDRMATGNAPEWLEEKGFAMGRGPSGTLRIGWRNGGPGGGHMAVTLPDGRHAESGGKVGKFTVGAGAAGADDFPNQAYLPVAAMYPDGYPSGSGRGVMGYGSSSGGGGGGATRSEQRQLRDAQQKVDDKAAAVTSAQQSLDELEGKEGVTVKQRTDRETRLARAQREYQDALDDQTAQQQEINDKILNRTFRDDDSRYTDRDKATAANQGPDAKSFGQSMLSGAMEALGFDGELFSDPTQWGIFKTGTGVANIFASMMKNWNWEGFGNATDGGNDLMKPWRKDRDRDSDSPRPMFGGMTPGPGVGDGGLSASGGGGGGGGAIGALTGMLPQVSDWLSNSQYAAAGGPTFSGASSVADFYGGPPLAARPSPLANVTTNKNTTNNQNSNNTQNNGQVFNGSVTINHPVQAKPPGRMNTYSSGLPK